MGDGETSHRSNMNSIALFNRYIADLLLELFCEESAVGTSVIALQSKVWFGNEMLGKTVPNLSHSS